MKKPTSEVANRVISIIEDRREMEVAIKELKEQANSLVAAISDDDDKIEIAAYLYWLYPEIRAKELAQAVLGDQNIPRFLAVIGSAAAGISCDSCGKLIVIESRSQLDSWKGAIDDIDSHTVICGSCRAESMAEQHEVWKDQKRAIEARLIELRRMPYREYLKTSEWQTRRKKHLKSAGYRCQLCNSSMQPLDVHHRTYERRGEEFYKDLIVLCRDCHSTFHEAGKLADH